MTSHRQNLALLAIWLILLSGGLVALAAEKPRESRRADPAPVANPPSDVPTDRAEPAIVANRPAELLRPAAQPRATINSKPRTVLMVVTAYCPCTKCCGPNAAGITASGKPVTANRGRFVAADGELFPFGSRVRVPGYYDAQSVEVLDRGSAIKGNRIDVYFASHQKAAEWGRRWVEVIVE
jgi:3D (Asp-Asp-Asp) domain-containing protein